MLMGDVNRRVINPFMVRRENKQWGKRRDQQGTEKETPVQEDGHQDREVFWGARKAMRSRRLEGQ